jgi:hypothetical protein
MSETGGIVAAKRAGVESAESGPLALELVAMRGKDVVGVRHLVDGGRAWVGPVADALARVPARDLGGHPYLVGEVRGGAFALSIPPRARARLHGADGIPRLMIGPHRIDLRRGDRAVLVLGGVQIRAQLVPYAAAGSPALKLAGTVVAWLGVIGLVYAAGMALAALLADRPSPVEPGALERVGTPLLPAPSR